MGTNGKDVPDPLWLSSYTEALERARRFRRPLLVDFWDPTCLGCLKMLQVTFPDPAVAELLKEEFVCLKIDTEALTEDARPLVRAHRLLWTPDLLFLDPAGAQLGRRMGFHPPAELLAVLRVVLGQSAMVHRDYGRAQALFRAAIEEPGASETRPEALFWAGIAAYKVAGGDRSVLRRHWSVLKERYAGTAWWTRAEASWGVETVTAAVAG